MLVKPDQLPELLAKLSGATSAVFEGDTGGDDEDGDEDAWQLTGRRDDF